MLDFENVLFKCVQGERVDRNDECVVYNTLAEIFGEENVLTEIDLENKDDVYFGCAIRQNGKWKVYNLIGTGGVVIKFGKRFALRVKVG